jgi:hypothetical protein
MPKIRCVAIATISTLLFASYPFHNQQTVQASEAPAVAKPLDTSTFQVRFDKQVAFGADGCYISSKLGKGQGLHCKIQAPDEAVGVIDSIQYDCNPEEQPMPRDSPCRHVYPCPSSAECFDDCPTKPCPSHQFAYEPHDLNLAEVRTVDWWAWTNDSNHAILQFTVHMRPKKVVTSTQSSMSDRASRIGS